MKFVCGLEFFIGWSWIATVAGDLVPGGVHQAKRAKGVGTPAYARRRDAPGICYGPAGELAFASSPRNPHTHAGRQSRRHARSQAHAATALPGASMSI